MLHWGDFERFKFNARIDTFSNRVEISQGNNRVVKTDFGLKLQGYIIPEAMNAFISKHPTKQFSKSILTNITEVIAEEIEHDRARQPINKVGDSGSGIGYDRIGHQQIG